MNKINRAVVKSQAREIIKGKVFPLFIISLIVSLLAGGGIRFNYNIEDIKDAFGSGYNKGSHFFDKGYDKDDDLDEYFDNYFDNYFDDYEDYDDSNPIENFGEDDSVIGGANGSTGMIVARGGITSVFAGLSSLSFIISIIFTPLTVTLCGIYLALIRRNPLEQFQLGNEIGGLFKDSFNATYANKLVVVILRGLFTALWSLLFIIPGIVYHYSAYFSYQIMSDNPNLKPTEALELSKKIVKGNRGELFALDLSFIAWYLLCLVTLGIASIYVTPYVQTTQALYYENFRLRALAEGRVTEYDFLSSQEKFERYNQPYQQYQPYGNQQEGSYYNVPQQPQANSNVYYSPDFSQPQQTDYVYNPQPEPRPTQPPQPEYYQPPVEQTPPTEPTDYYTPDNKDINE